MNPRTVTGLPGRWAARLVTLLAALVTTPLWAQAPEADPLRLGGVMDLEGDSKALGQGMKAGIEAALQGRTFRGRPLEYKVLNDYYNPATTGKATRQLLEEGVFAMVGNVGTPTARVALPLLAAEGVPAVGFYTGADLLRPGPGNVINFRASYVQEVQAVITAALAAGVPPAGICAYVQNDSYGMAGVAGIHRALEGRPDSREERRLLAQIMALEGDDLDRNFLGPVGFYQRNTLSARAGYDSLKHWEEIHGQPCQLVVTVGTYTAVANFIAYAHYKDEPWVYSAVSFTGADGLRQALGEYGIQDRVIMTQVVPPPLTSNLPIVQEARQALGEELGHVSLEGYIVGRLVLAILDNLEGELTRDNFLKSVQGRVFDLGGLVLDFGNDNQGSDLVLLTLLQDGDYRVIMDLRPLFKN